MWASFSNQNLESEVRISPLRGMAVGKMQSNAEILSVATTSRSSSSTAYTSRTFPRRISFNSERDVCNRAEAVMALSLFSKFEESFEKRRARFTSCTEGCQEALGFNFQLAGLHEITQTVATNLGRNGTRVELRPSSISLARPDRRSGSRQQALNRAS